MLWPMFLLSKIFVSLLQSWVGDSGPVISNSPLSCFTSRAISLGSSQSSAAVPIFQPVLSELGQEQSRPPYFQTVISGIVSVL